MRYNIEAGSNVVRCAWIMRMTPHAQGMWHQYPFLDTASCEAKHSLCDKRALPSSLSFPTWTTRPWHHCLNIDGVDDNCTLALMRRSRLLLAEGNYYCWWWRMQCGYRPRQWAVSFPSSIRRGKALAKRMLWSVIINEDETTVNEEEAVGMVVLMVCRRCNFSPWCTALS